MEFRRVLFRSGTERGLKVGAVVDGGEVIASLGERVLGRTAQEDIVDPLNSKVIVKRGDLIQEDKIDQIERAGIDTIFIRSALMCESVRGVCGACYGRDLACGTKVSVGAAVGVIDAQSTGRSDERGVGKACDRRGRLRG